MRDPLNKIPPELRLTKSPDLYISILQILQKIFNFSAEISCNSGILSKFKFIYLWARIYHNFFSFDWSSAKTLLKYFKSIGITETILEGVQYN